SCNAVALPMPEEPPVTRTTLSCSRCMMPSWAASPTDLVLLGRERVGSSSMNGQLPNPNADLATKIARLVEERGWNQEDFARTACLNRQTVREIMQPSADRRLRHATVSACARALGLSVSELRTLPLERLL